MQVLRLWVYPMVSPSSSPFPLTVASSVKHRRVLGENIRNTRKLAGLSQEKLAEKAELNPAYVSDVERGTENISVDALIRISEALDTTVHNLTRGI